MITEYIALAEKVSDGYTVFFPNIPGFGSAGNTLEEARHNARNGLLAHLELLLQIEEGIPNPLTLDEVAALPELKSALFLNIPTVIPTKKALRINVTLDESLLQAIDELAKRQYKSRGLGQSPIQISGFIIPTFNCSYAGAGMDRFPTNSLASQ